MNKSLTYLLFFTFYTMLLLLFGKDGFKKTGNSRDFFVADNELGLVSCIFTFIATWFSAASIQGVTGSIYAYGYSVILYSIVGWFFGAVLLIFMAIKLKDYDILTVPEYFNIRYNSSLLQALGGATIVLCYVLYIIIQIRGFGIVMSELLDINYNISIFLVYLFVIYTTFGGLFSVAKTDGLNAILIVIGTLLAAIIILSRVGGFESLNFSAGLISTKPYISFPDTITKGALLDPFCNGVNKPSIVFTIALAWGLGLAANPQYAIRISSAKNKRTAVNMIWISVLVLAWVYICVIIIGIGSRVMLPYIYNIESVDEIYPFVINNVIDSPLSGLILISVAAAAVSTANSQLLIVASSFSYDIYRNCFNKNINDESLLKLNRLVIFVAGTVSLVLSIKPPTSLLIYGSYIWGILSVTFLLPLYGGFYWSKATEQGALASYLGGMLTMLIFFCLRIMGYKYVVDIHPVLPGVVVAFILFIIVSSYTYKSKESGTYIIDEGVDIDAMGHRK